MIAGVAVVLGIVALLALVAIWRGFVLSILWGWFMVPFGLPAISVALAIGVAVTVGMITHQSASSKSDDAKDKFGASILQAFLFPLLALGIGWIAHQYA